MIILLFVLRSRARLHEVVLDEIKPFQAIVTIIHFIAPENTGKPFVIKYKYKMDLKCKRWSEMG